MIVLDASAAVLGLLNDGETRQMLRDQPVVCPHLVDADLIHALRGLVRRGDLDAEDAQRALVVWGRLGLARLAVHGLIARVWQLRDHLGAYDASYVALAEALEVPLVTADGRLARASGPRCIITVVRR